jgi:PKD repeat protein
VTKLHRAFGISAILSVFTAAVAGVAAPALAQESTYTVDPVAVTGEPAPGTGGLNFGCIPPWPADVSDTGIVAFSASLELCDTGYPGPIDDAIWVGTPSNLTLVARTGDPAPGSTAQTFNRLYGTFVNNSGDLAVHGDLDTSTGYPDNGVWTRSSGVLNLLAKTGDTAPGTAGLPFLDVGAGGFNDLGVTTFWAAAGDEFNWQSGLWTGTQGSLQSVVLSGDPAPGTAGLYFADVGLTSAQSDSIAFSALTTNPDPNLSVGIWTAGPTGVNPVALAGDQAPGTGGRVIQTFFAEPGTIPEQIPQAGELFAYLMDTFVLNQAGDVAFTAYVNPLDPLDTYRDAGIWTRDSAGLGLVALTDEIAPGTADAPYLYFNHVNFNASGQVAFDASLDIADPASDHGIWAGLPGSLNLIAREGDPAPGTVGETFGGLVMGPSLNDSGEVAFFARLRESGTDGVWAAAADGSLSLIAREGETIQINSGDYRTIQLIEPFDGGMGGYSFFSVFNNTGQLAFTATFTDGTTALLLASPVSTSPNQPPIANAGPDQTVMENNTILVDGSASNDPDGTILSFVWSLGGVEIATEPKATVGPFGPGIHTVTLTVTDRNGVSTSDDMILTVEPNIPPVANAGPDQTVTDLQMVTFDGSVSSDPEGGALTYVWNIGPIEFATGQSPTDGPFVPGVYTVTLTVTDEVGATATDTMILTVVNLPPVADAGPDRTMQTLESIVLDGSGSSDPEGAPLSYVWSIDGTQFSTNPSTIVAPGPSDVGVHTITLTVTDNYGATASDEMILTVLNRAPTANAGLDQTANHTQTVTLDATGSTDPEGGVLTYAWSVGGVQIATGANPVVGPFEVGAHTVTLTVTDDQGATASDSMVVNVVNEAPVANAGPDQTVYIAKGKSKNVSVTVDGSASIDPEGGALSYLWTLDGQTAGTSAIVQTNLTAGVYSFTLTVTDDHGVSAVDSVVVTVSK